jgi:hypothetical protein
MKRGIANKKMVLTLVERGGRARSIMAEDITGKVVRNFLVTNADRKSVLMTDESGLYKKVGKSSNVTSLSITARANTLAASPPRTPWKATSQSSSAA